MAEPITTLLFVLGSSPDDNGNLDPAATERVKEVARRWSKGERFFVVFVGRQSNRNWPESEAACMKRNLLTTHRHPRRPVPSEMMFVDNVPKSTAESLQRIPQWEHWFRADKAVDITTIKVVSNAAYQPQFEALREGQQLDACLSSNLSFHPAPDFGMSPADHRRLARSLWKARIDPFDRWINQWRISRQSRPVRLMLLAADFAIACALTLVRAVGIKPRQRPGYPPPFISPLPAET